MNKRLALKLLLYNPDDHATYEKSTFHKSNRNRKGGVVMNRGKGRYLRTGLKRSLMAFVVFMLACPFVFAPEGSAKVVRTAPVVVSGVIQDITPTSIEVNGKYYDISDAVLFTTSGTKMTKKQVSPGQAAELIIEDGVVIKVRVSIGKSTIRQ